MRRAAAAARFATILNVCALPVYALTFTMIAGHLSVRWSWRPIVGLIAGTLASAGAVLAWRRSERAGAITQGYLIMPVLASAFIPAEASWAAFEGRAFLDVRVILGIALAVVIPAALVASSVIGLMRHGRGSDPPSL